jgi:GTP cyclohydrolase I
MRGVRKYNSPFETINVTGLFLENKNGCKDEFITRIST